MASCRDGALCADALEADAVAIANDIVAAKANLVILIVVIALPRKHFIRRFTVSDCRAAVNRAVVGTAKNLTLSDAAPVHDPAKGPQLLLPGWTARPRSLALDRAGDRDKSGVSSGNPVMDKFTTLEGVAAPLKIINVDTDMIIPKQYLKTIKRTGLGKGLFSEQRYKDDGSENPDFILNKPAYRHAKVLVAGDNFGCGSSREHAPWALLDFGIRCVISTSFGDIFYNNCFKNGILPIRVKQEDLDKLFDDAERGANATLTIDLASQEIRGPDGGTLKFEIDAFRKHCLLNGLDDIGLTMEKKSSIDTYEAKAKTERAWA
jgi:3-isopropylmalate/(R)-2-methylmalate dehydratase small subunit